jgi:hypothetical protein
MAWESATEGKETFMRFSMSPATGLAMLALACPLAALSAPLTVQNFSFESGNLAITQFPQGAFSNLVPLTNPTGGTLDHWTAIDTTAGNYIGGYDPVPGNSNNWTFLWETGNVVGYAQSLGGGAQQAGLSQVLGDLVAGNMVYTLRVDVGRRSFTLNTWNYSIELWADGVLLGSQFGFPGMGANSAATDTLTVITGAGHPQIGEPLEIRLMTNGNITEAFFDNVRLDASPVPEPGTWALAAAGLLLSRLLRKR